MIISIASGKGGTGKTTVATNLAFSLKNNVQLLDCDHYMFLCNSILHKFEEYKQEMDYMNLGITRRCTGRQFRCAPLPPVSLVANPMIRSNTVKIDQLRIERS